MNEVDWDVNKRYFEGYDRVQLNSNRYITMLDWFFTELQDCERVLEAGAGTGNLTYKLLANSQKVGAYDINPWALKILEQKCGMNDDLVLGVKDFSLANLEIVPEYDAASSMIVLPFPQDIRQYCLNVYDSLVDGGKFVLASWSLVPDIYRGVIEMTEEELESKGLLENLGESWLQIKNDGIFFAEEIIKRDFSLEKLVLTLKETGFRRIDVRESHYNNRYTYPIVCYK